MTSAIEKALENLRKNRMNAVYVETKADVVPLLKTLLNDGETIGVGGSVTLDETGVTEFLRNGNYNFLDRYAPDLSPEQREEILLHSNVADVYLSSSNAITEDGELYNVDGNSNRVAALAYGPKRVIVVAGINKLVPDLEAAVRRVKTDAAPKNASRLHRQTYCAAAGHCMGLDGGMTAGCHSPQRICCSYLISGFQRVEGRITVILVGEECGY